MSIVLVVHRANEILKAKFDEQSQKIIRIRTVGKIYTPIFSFFFWKRVVNIAFFRAETGLK